MLLLMMIDHSFFMGFTQWTAVRDWLYGFFGYITAAEGFFCLSGIVCAIAMHRSFLPGALPATARIWKRARTIWGWHVIVVVVSCLCVIIHVAHHEAVVAANPYLAGFLAHPLVALFLAPLLLTRPPFLEILPLYIIYLAATPLLLGWFATGRAWLAWLVTGLLWGLGQWGLWSAIVQAARRMWPELPLEAGYFDPFAWLAPYVLGLAIGCLWQRGVIERVGTARLVLFPLSILVCGFLWAHHHRLLPGVPPFADWLVDISQLGPVRIVNLVCAITMIGFLIEMFPRAFSGQSVAFLGRHSLPVFVWHVGLLFAAFPVWAWTQSLPLGDPLGLALLAILLASLWIPAWLHERSMKTPLPA